MKMKLGVLFLGIPWPCILYQISLCGAENQVLGCGGFVKASKTIVFPRINVQLYSKAGSPATCPDNALAGAGAPDGLNQLCHVQSSPPTLPSATTTKYQVLSAQLDFTTASHILPGLCWASARAGQMSPFPQRRLAPSWCCSSRQLFSLC